jgi:cytoskeletal protein RodZ
MKRIAILAVLLMFSGCICCGGKDISDFMPGKKTSQDDSVEDVSQDEGAGEDVSNQGDNTPADEGNQDETVTTTQPEEIVDMGAEETATTLESGTEEATTTQPQDTATTQPAVTTTLKTNSKTAACVVAAGYNADHVIFGYSQNCGAKFVSTASQVSITGAVDIDAINIGGFIDDNKIKMLECYYGPYSETNTLFRQCPVLLCPKTGEVKILGLQGGNVQSQMSGFAGKCA